MLLYQQKIYKSRDLTMSKQNKFAKRRKTEFIFEIFFLIFFLLQSKNRKRENDKSLLTRYNNHKV